METAEQRAIKLGWQVVPLSYHDDLYVIPHSYDYINDILNIDVMPKSAPKWAETAYQFAKHGNMKFDKRYQPYGVDGQPRVATNGVVWVRFITPFVERSQAALHIWSRQPNHAAAEIQLMKFYRLFQKRDGLEPIDVFRKYLQ